MDELQEVIHVTKKSKAPGPDKTPAEFRKWPDNDNKQIILQCFNNCWETETMPDHFTLAEVVMLYKKGATSDPANYRPIGLLNSSYKLYAAMIQGRLLAMDKNRRSPVRVL